MRAEEGAGTGRRGWRLAGAAEGASSGNLRLSDEGREGFFGALLYPCDVLAVMRLLLALSDKML